MRRCRVSLSLTLHLRVMGVSSLLRLFRLAVDAVIDDDTSWMSAVVQGY